MLIETKLLAAAGYSKSREEGQNRQAARKRIQEGSVGGAVRERLWARHGHTSFQTNSAGNHQTRRACLVVLSASMRRWRASPRGDRTVELDWRAHRRKRRAAHHKCARRQSLEKELQ